MDTARTAGGSRTGGGSSSGSSSSGGSSSSSGGSSGSSSSGGSSSGSGGSSSGGGSSGGGSSSGGSSSSSSRSSGGRSPGSSTASMVSKLSIAKPPTPPAPKTGTSLPSGGATSGRGADRYSTGPTGTGGIQTLIINPVNFGLVSTADLGAKKTNTPGVQDERTKNSDNDNTLKADDQVLDEPVQPEPEIIIDIVDETPEEEMPEETIPLDEPPIEIIDDPILEQETKIADEPPIDFDSEIPDSPASEIVDGHTDPILTIPKLNMDGLKSFYQNNKEHLAIAVGVVGLVIGTSKLKSRN